MSLQAVPVPIASLRQHPRNPRTIRPERLEQLARVLQADPLMLEARPLIALPDGTVIAGNQRLSAALSLGWETVPCVTVDLDEARALEWALRDNESFGEWDDRMRAEILADLAAQSRDPELTGGTTADIESLLRSIRPVLVDPDEAPPIPLYEATSVLGETYALGNHVLVCADSLTDEAHDLLGCSPDCILTDPPYGINLETDYSKLPVGSSKAEQSLAKKRGVYRPIIGDDRPFDASFIVDRYPKVAEQFWFGGDYYRRTLSERDLDGAYLVWDKRSETTDVVLGSGFELIWSRQPHKRDLLRHYWCGAMGSAEARGRMHPTQKPTALLMEILERWTKEGAAVLDPFGGSGSTLLACEQAGRKCFTIEIDRFYCDVIRRRYAMFVGDDSLLP